MQVEREGRGHRIVGMGEDVALANRFLDHLSTREFAPATVRTYAFHLLSFLRFCAERELTVAEVRPPDLFEFLDWLRRRRRSGATVVPIVASTPAAATINQRVAAVRALFDYAVLAGSRTDNPVPSGRRSSGLRAKRRGLLGHISAGRQRTGGRLVREPRRLPEALEPDEVEAFVANLETHRDRAMALAMLLGGLRAGEVRSLRLADVDQGLRRVRVVGKGNKERVVPVDGPSSPPSPPTCATNAPRDVRRRSASSCCGDRPAARPCPRRGCGASSAPTELAREPPGCGLTASAIPTAPSWPPPGSICSCCGKLMGHASPETTAGYVHLSPEALAVEYAKANRR